MLYSATGGADAGGSSAMLKDVVDVGSKETIIGYTAPRAGKENVYGLDNGLRLPSALPHCTSTVFVDPGSRSVQLMPYGSGVPDGLGTDAPMRRPLGVKVAVQKTAPTGGKMATIPNEGPPAAAERTIGASCSVEELPGGAGGGGAPLDGRLTVEGADPGPIDPSEYTGTAVTS